MIRNIVRGIIRAARFSRTPAILSSLAILAACSWSGSTETPLVTGRDISPRAGVADDLGSLPLNLVFSSDHRFGITTDAGYRQSLHVIRLSDARSISHVDFPNRARASSAVGEATTAPARSVTKANGLYYGLALSANGVLYAAQGEHDTIAVLSLSSEGVLTANGEIAAQSGDFPAGLALDSRGRLYVANQRASSRISNPYDSPGSVAIYDTTTRREIGRYTFRDSFYGTSNFPLAIAVRHDGSKAYVASERDSAVYVLNTTDPAHLTPAATIPTGSHPSALLLNRDESRLFVANSDSDTISVIDTIHKTVASTILLRPDLARDLPGATPTAMDLSTDEATLYVALADMNAVVVVDLRAQAVRGYLPVGWYPSALAESADGKSLCVVNAKGSRLRTPNMQTDPQTGRVRNESPLNLLEGNVQIVAIPDGDALTAATEEVLRNNHLDRLAKPTPLPLANLTRQSGKITHIIYIIKENRTYDQVLGDLPAGNGDPALCLFPRDTTPNQHALAERFVLLDNLYTCGEVSGDGWCWSTQSMANPYVIRNVPYHYSGRGRKFDFEGQNNGYPTGGFPATDTDGKPLATAPFFKDGAKPIPDVAEAAGGHIWDLCTKHGISFRNYGFFDYFADTVAGVPGGPENYPSAAGLQPAGHDLTGRTDSDFRRFDMDYADSDAPATLYRQTGNKDFLYPMTTYGKADAPSRFAEWQREFHLMLAKDPAGNAVPALTMIRLPKDHTVGTRPGDHTPASFVADNDYALGQIVQEVSRWPIWQHTAIFVIEDDAQSGPDHVDCHRTTGFVISPYIRQGAVDHHFYNTNSFIATMERLLGLPPMTQYDGTATLLASWTDSPRNSGPYTAIMPDAKYFAQLNPSLFRSGALSAEAARLAKASQAMDFSHEDAAPALLLNEIIWKSVKGMDSQPPAPRTSAILPTKPDDDD